MKSFKTSLYFFLIFTIFDQTQAMEHEQKKIVLKTTEDTRSVVSTAAYKNRSFGRKKLLGTCKAIIAITDLSEYYAYIEVKKPEKTTTTSSKSETTMTTLILDMVRNLKTKQVPTIWAIATKESKESFIKNGFEQQPSHSYPSLPQYIQNTNPKSSSIIIMKYENLYSYTISFSPTKQPLLFANFAEDPI